MGKRMKRYGFLAFPLLAVFLAQGVAAADDVMPPPKSAPRIKVQQKRLLVEEGRGNRVVTGLAKAVDAERMKVGDTELRLFGIVMPQQNAVRGAEARAALEKLLLNEVVTCRIQERDKGWRLLGSCSTDKHPDLSLVLLQEGWAVVARGSVQQTEFADIYLAAEANAQIQKRGMWTPISSVGAGGNAENGAVRPAEAAPASSAQKSGDKTTETSPRDSAIPATKNIESGVGGTQGASEIKPAMLSPVLAAGSTSLQVPTMTPSEAMLAAAPVIQSQSAPGSVAWLWFAGLTPAAVMILYGLGQIALRRYEYQQERKALAAALRGELMAARAICISRADTLGYGAEAVSKLSNIWPRLRSTIYQAYVGRIGLLGPDLARRVSSLYGQFADYAQFYAARPNAEAAGKIDNATVQQTLFTIIDHIEDTLNNLQNVETSGRAPVKLLPPRPGATAARMQRLAEMPPRREKLEFVEAELVQDEMAREDIKLRLGSSVFPSAKEGSAKENASKMQAMPAESEAQDAGKIIAAVIRQDDKVAMTAETLASITATHDALRQDEDKAKQGDSSDHGAVPENPAGKPAGDVAKGSAGQDAVAPKGKDQSVAVERKADDSVQKDNSAATGAAAEDALVGVRKSASARRRARQEARMNEVKQGDAENKTQDGEYYDFRSQAVRTANK